MLTTLHETPQESLLAWQASAAGEKAGKVSADLRDKSSISLHCIIHPIMFTPMTLTGDQPDNTIARFVPLLLTQRPVSPVNYKSTNRDIINISLP